MPVEILLVEDNPGDVRLARESLSPNNKLIHLQIACDGAEAIAVLTKQGTHADAPRPDVVMLDLNLPHIDGRKVLAFIKGNDGLKSIPVIIVTASDEEGDIVASYENGAKSYHIKPVLWEEFESLVKTIHDFWMGKSRLPRQNLSK
jgi:two-component system, chemotaxis family, response regulator Rcp1